MRKRKLEATQPSCTEEEEEEEPQTASLKRAVKKPKPFHEEQTEEKSSRKSSPKKIAIYNHCEPVPTKDATGRLVFRDYPEFRPNLTPKEVMQRGSFGGTYFRDITSGVTGKTYHDAWKEFPEDWFEGLNIAKQVSSQKYDVKVNTYRINCGCDLHTWETSGWISEADPYGWFQWYCRFYLGRRCEDDERQLARGLGVMGPRGRWRRTLINKCLAADALLEDALEDVTISPKVRQLLQHWGYELTLSDLETAARTQRQA